MPDDLLTVPYCRRCLISVGATPRTAHSRERARLADLRPSTAPFCKTFPEDRRHAITAEMGHEDDSEAAARAAIPITCEVAHHMWDGPVDERVLLCS